MAPERTNDRKRDSERRRTTETEQQNDAPAHPLLQLQRQVGNRQVARMLAQRDASVQREAEEEQQSVAPALVQRMTSEAPEVGLEGGQVSSGLAQRIQSQRGGGSPLPSETRSLMESRMGADFSGVKVHTGGESASLNRAVSAKAFTTGSDIFLGKDASTSDKGLIAHELTHVVQQSAMRSTGPMTVSKDGDAHEAEADSVSRAVTSGAVQRKPDDESEQ